MVDTNGAVDTRIELGEQNPNWQGMFIVVKPWLTFVEQTRAEEAGRTVSRTGDTIAIATDRVEQAVAWAEAAVLEWQLQDRAGQAILPTRASIENAVGASPLLTAATEAIKGFYEEADAQVFPQSANSA